MTRGRLIKAFLLFFMTLLFAAAIGISPSETNILSWFLADTDHDLRDELLLITKGGADTALDTGEEFGNYLKIYSDFKIVNHVPVLQKEPDYQFDLSDIKPLRVQAGDMNGDGEEEIAVCVYKTTKFHPVFAKRPFFYNIRDGELCPVWLGSRLSRPFTDYVLFDADGDGIDEIISIELLENGNKAAAVYDWKGFGFEVKAVSDELAEETAFINSANAKQEDLHIKIAGENYQILLIDGRIEFKRYGKEINR